ncbi:MAG: radical SAM family heme chaperone HemW [Candidatus Limnocylindrales bacterium]
MPPPLALYIHVPFCISICPYCDFVVYAGREARGERSRLTAFLAALHVELDLRADLLAAQNAGQPRPPLRSVYLGGGTPSLLSAPQVTDLLDHVARRYGMAADAEVTIEVNPGSADRGDLRGYRAAGVGRASIGVQSLQASELRTLGRRHSATDVAATVELARAAAFDSVSIDLLYDIPGQTLETWSATLHTALGLAVDHVSAYALTLDDPAAEGLTGILGDHRPVRAGARAWRDSVRPGQDEDRAAEMYELASDRLEGAGLAGYELSNWARAGHESRHNLVYWQRQPYAGLGPGAHAFDGAGRRTWTAASLATYLSVLTPARRVAASLPVGGVELVDDSAAVAEAAILGLRLRRGIPVELARHPVVSAGLAWGMSHGLLEPVLNRVRLTPRGRLLADEVFARLLPAGTTASHREAAA